MIRRRARPGGRTSAFTLLELLLVLALLVVMGGMAWPVLRGPMSESRLRQASRNFASQLGRFRLEAIERGMTLELRHAAEGGEFRLSPAEADRTDALQRASEQSSPTTSADAALVEERRFRLPEGIVFVEENAWEGEPAWAGDGSRAETRASGVDAGGAGPTGGGADDAHGGGELVVSFFPDGTTSNATFVLGDDRGQRARVVLRGLIGSARALGVTRVGPDAIATAEPAGAKR